MTRLSRDALRRQIGDKRTKQEFVTAMFDVVAPRYDDFTRRFSLGMDAGWKRHILQWIDEANIPEGAAVDLACGTGDLAAAVAARFPTRAVTGIDASPRMIEAAAARRVPNASAAPTFMLGDMMQPAVADQSTALVTVGYGFRNVPDFRHALRQVARMSREDGVIVTLDFYIPTFPPWRFLFLGWLRLAGILFGWFWHRSPAVYEYISHSIRHFVSADEFARELAAAGFRVEKEKRWLWGGIAAHFARRVPRLTR